MVPLRLHFGTAGVCPPSDYAVSTVSPGIHGGNVENREFVVGTSMFYPVHKKARCSGPATRTSPKAMAK